MCTNITTSLQCPWSSINPSVVGGSLAWKGMVFPPRRQESTDECSEGQGQGLSHQIFSADEPTSQRCNVCIVTLHNIVNITCSVLFLIHFTKLQQKALEINFLWVCKRKRPLCLKFKSDLKSFTCLPTNTFNRLFTRWTKVIVSGK